MLRSITRCPAAWPACGSPLSLLRQRLQLSETHQSVANSRQGPLDLLSWLCKCTRSAMTASHRAAIPLQPISQQHNRFPLSAFSVTHRWCHATVAPRSRGGRAAEQQLAEGRRAHGRPVRRDRRKLPKAGPAQAPARAPELPEPPPEPPRSTSRLLRTSNSESEHMHVRHRHPVQPPPAAASPAQPPRKSRRKREPPRPKVEGQGRVIDRGRVKSNPGLLSVPHSAAASRVRPAERSDTGTDSSERSTQHRRRIRKRHATARGELQSASAPRVEQQRAPRSATAATSASVPTPAPLQPSLSPYVRVCDAFFGAIFWSLQAPQVVSPLSAATLSAELQAAQIDSVWQVARAGSGAGLPETLPLWELHTSAKEAQSMDIEGRKRSLSMSLALFDRCTKLVRTATLSDGMLLQGVRDAAFHARICQLMKVSYERDEALNKIQAFMVAAARKSLRAKLSRVPDTAVPDTGPLTAPSPGLLQGLALCFTFAEAGVTSAEYVEAVSQLLCNETQALAGAPSTPVSFIAAATVMQGLALSGSSSESAKRAQRTAVRMCTSSVPTALSALAQQHTLPVPELTKCDWARFFVPRMGLVQGFRAAFRAPAPLLHMHGLHVRVEGVDKMSQFSLSPPVQTVLPAPGQAGRRGRTPKAQQPRPSRLEPPWRVYASWGQRNPTDTLALLLHSFFVAHLRQTGLSKAAAALDPSSFTAEFRASFAAEDQHLVSSIYHALHALGKGDATLTTEYPGQLLLADCVGRQVGLALPTPRKEPASPPATLSQHEIAIAWNNLRIYRRHTVLLSDTADRDMLKQLYRVGLEQPPLRERLLSSDYALHNLRSRWNVHDACDTLRAQLTSELPRDATDAKVCKWLAKTLSQRDANERASILRMAALEDAAKHIAWLSRVPDSTLSLRLCLNNPELLQSRDSSSHSDSVSALVESLPQGSSNQQVAQGVQDLVFRAPEQDTLQVCTFAVDLAKIVHTVGAMRRLQQSPAHACKAVDRIRKMKALQGLHAVVKPHEASSVLMLQQIEAGVRNSVVLRRVGHVILNSVLESSAAAAGLAPVKRHMQWGMPADEIAGHSGSPLQEDWSGSAWRLLREGWELWGKAGTGEEVDGCRVGSELNRQSRHLNQEPPGKQFLPEELRQACQSALDRSQGRPSEMQKVVHTALQKLRYPVLSETRLSGLPMQVDVLTCGVDRAGRARHVVVEVDGPSHFLHSPDCAPELNPADDLKAAALLLHGVPTIRVAYKDWERIGVSGQGLLHGELQVSWLEQQLRIRGIVGPSLSEPGKAVGEQMNLAKSTLHTRIGTR